MNEFSKIEENIILNTEYAEAYIPFELYDDKAEKKSSVVTEFGEGIKTIGLFNMRFFPSDTASRHSTPLRTFNYPNMIVTYPTSHDVSTIALERGDEPEKYIILKYYKGDIIMNSAIEMNSTNCEVFLNLIMKGKIPKTLNYQDILKSWEQNFDINGIDPGVPSLTLQLILSEQCRSFSNPALQYRKVAGKKAPGEGKEKYYIANMRTVASLTSVFNALTFENEGDMLMASINMTRENIPQFRSPIEKVLTM